ncbi:MAG: tyrosine-type recombinase/integrase [Alphaproteobacteria bacterium]|nr:tyrosine-type recombinase/integrase [Alphaproteobacteria bacterium]
MADRKRTRLTDRTIVRLRPREREYTVWDSHCVGLGVRVRPTGARSYVLLENTAGRSRRVSLGPVSLKTVKEVRRECHVRKAEPEASAAPGRSAPSFRDFVEDEWKQGHFEGYKPSTRKAVQSLLDRELLPAFGSTPLDRITPARIGRWFDRFSRTAPGNANHALDLLAQIISFAIARGYLRTNPTRAQVRNPRTAYTRFLSREELTRLHRVLDSQTRTGRQEQADIIRLLLLTGCRRNEVVGLRWSEVDHDRLVLADSKTGPRTVPLNTQARHILERRSRGASPFVFPSPTDPSRPRSRNLSFWSRARREACIEDVRLHDLRHTHASHAVMNGVPVPVVARLLGHSDVRTTLRYAHLGDREVERAAERIGCTLAGLCGLQTERQRSVVR